MEHGIASDEIGLRGLLSIAGRRWKTILVVAVAATAGALAYAMAQTPQYEATATLLAGQGEGIADVQAITAVNQATQSLARMSTDRVVVEAALEQLKLADVDPVELSARVRSNVPANTQQIELTVTDPDPKRATLLANGIARAFSTLVDEKAAPESNLSATVWQPAIEPRVPASPNVPLLAALGLLGGLVLGAGLAAAREALDVRWRDEQAVEQELGVPVLAVIPQISSRTARRRAYA